MTTAVFAVGLAAAAAAEDPKFLGTFKSWAAYSVDTAKGKVCFLHSKPTKEQGNYARRGEVYVQVTHRPKENVRDVVSFTTGYSYKENSDVEVEIGDSKYSMFTSEDTAWAREPKVDRDLVLAMVKGSTMVVRGTSNRGTLTTDTYSLSGFTAAYNAMSAACDIKPTG